MDVGDVCVNVLMIVGTGAGVVAICALAAVFVATARGAVAEIKKDIRERLE